MAVLTPSSLIPNGHGPGAGISIQHFCSLYSLRLEIETIFIDNGFRFSSALEYISPDELKEMGFLRGDIAEIKRAIAQWSVIVLE